MIKGPGLFHLDHSRRYLKLWGKWGFQAEDGSDYPVLVMQLVPIGLNQAAKDNPGDSGFVRLA